MKKLKAGDLGEIKARVTADRTLKTGKTTVRITVHMGTCGIAAGAREILATFTDETERRKLQGITITTSGCAGLCSSEPMVTVESCNKPPVKYVNVTAEKAEKIFAEHIIKGKIAIEYGLATSFESTAL